MKVLITGGSGFLGEALIRRLITNAAFKTEMKDIRVVARNEGKLLLLKQAFPEIEIMTGDITDEFIARKAVKDILICFHLAAFKHVGIAEKQPVQCVNSNVIGTLNLLKYFVGRKFVAISTDKAAKVAGVYGASKLLMERVIKEYEELNPNIEYKVVRYGNVLYSTGSVLVKWKDALLSGKEIIVTDPKATRFFWTVEQAIDLIEDCLVNATDASPYCPSMKSIVVEDLLEAMQRKYGRAVSIKEIGLQAGENLHEKILEDGEDSNESEKYDIDEVIQMI